MNPQLGGCTKIKALLLESRRKIKMAANLPPHTMPAREPDPAPASLEIKPPPCWLEILSSEDPGAMWERLDVFVRSAVTNPDADYDEITQGFFLLLLATGRFDTYREEQSSDAEIEVDLLSLLRPE